MNCTEARKTLYPSPGKCAVTIDTAQATEHLRECADCRSYFETVSRWSDLLREKAGSGAAPEALRERIAKQIEKQRADHSPERQLARRRRRWMVAAVLFAIALPAAWLAYRFSSQQFFQTLCEDHARYLNAESQVRSSEPAALEAWFRDKADFGVRVPALESAELLGGRLCFLRQHKAALIFYSKHGRTVSLFQFSGRGISLRALDRSIIDGAPLWCMSYKGFSLAAFENRGIVSVLVSDLREGELLELASAAQAKARGY